MKKYKNIAHHFAVILTDSARSAVTEREKEIHSQKARIKAAYEANDNETVRRLHKELSFSRCVLKAIQQEIIGWKLCAKYENQRYHGKIYSTSVLSALEKKQDYMKKMRLQYRDLRIDLTVKDNGNHLYGIDQYRQLEKHYQSAEKAYMLAATV